MARRRPLKLDDSDNLVEMSDIDLSRIKARMISLYGVDPSVKLSVVPSGGNLSGAPLLDTRLVSTGSSLVSDPLKPLEKFSVEYNRILQTIDSAAITPIHQDSNFTGFPVFLNASDQIQSMTESDFYDTFVESSIETLTRTGWNDSEQSGTYIIAQSNFVPDATLVSTTPVFINTIANAEAFASGALPEDSDQPLQLNTYFLHQINYNTLTTSNGIVIDDSNHLQELTNSNFDNILQKSIRANASRLLTGMPSRTIRYSWDSGNNRGTAILDTILDSTGDGLGIYDNYEQDFEYTQYDSALPYIVRTDGVRHQIVPSGKESVYQTYYLKIKRI